MQAVVCFVISHEGVAMYTVIFTSSTGGLVFEGGNTYFRDDTNYFVYNTDTYEMNLLAGGMLNNILSMYSWDAFTNMFWGGQAICGKLIINHKDLGVILGNEKLNLAWRGRLYELNCASGLGRIAIIQPNKLLFMNGLRQTYEFNKNGCKIYEPVRQGKYSGHAGASLMRWLL